MALDVQEGKGKKKKGPRTVYKVLIKRKKANFGKKKNAPFRRNRNTFTNELNLKKGVQQAAKVIEKMNLFRKDLHHDALRRIAALHSLSVHKTAIKKIEKKENNAK